MAKKRRKKGKTGRRPSVSKQLLRQKANRFLKAEKEFWETRYNLEFQLRESAGQLELEIDRTILDNLSSIVWALNDGIAFVRYKSEKKQGDVQFRTLPISLEEWGKEWLIVPTAQGEISLVKAGVVRGLGNMVFSSCKINDVEIPYVELAHARYDQGDLPQAAERAIIDFQLAFLGNQLRQVPIQGRVEAGNAQGTISALKNIAQQLEDLLKQEVKEELLQQFIRDHPFVLHSSAEVIPKKKLGEDFVTDFVLVSLNDQGPIYTLVEIEQSSHPILTRDNSLSSQANHAIKQTRDWDVWLEANKGYLRNKLPGFETPQYLIVIGRSHDLDETAKQYLRSYNREWKNTELLTYDDILVRFRGVINSLETATLSEVPQ